MNYIEQLKELYEKNTKHSNYQILSKKLTEIISNDQIVVKTRHELERFNFVTDYIDFENKSVLDIGGNTGYFSFESLEKGANLVHHYEGNKEHSDFVKMAAKALEYEDKVIITNDYFKFKNEIEHKYDVTFLLNVLHHLGDDYGNKEISKDEAKKQMSEQLKSMASITNVLIFQMGYCWKGDREKNLFEKGIKEEVISFVKNASSGIFEIIEIGIPFQKDDVIIYDKINSENIKRYDSLGEFLNRPLFILKSI